MVETQELLLIFAAVHGASEPHGRYRVTQRASPRVCIAEPLSGATKEALRRMDGVDAVLAPGESPAARVRVALTETEALFVDAYVRRFRLKARPGDGLDWDAAAFLPPDPPRDPD